MDDDSSVRTLVLSICDLKQNGCIPSPRVAAQLATSATKLFLHGGADDQNVYGDLYCMEIEKALWHLVSVGGFTKPSGRYGHSLNTFNNNRLVLFGGMAASVEEEIVLDTELSRTFSPPLFMGSNAKMWTHQETPNNQLFILNVDNLVWSCPEFEGDVPSPRAFHSAFIFNNFLIIFGGCEDKNFQKPCNDLYAYSINSQKWICLQQNGSIPSPRFAHKMVYAESKDIALLFGGRDDDGKIFSLNLSNLSKIEDVTSIFSINIDNRNNKGSDFFDEKNEIVKRELQCDKANQKNNSPFFTWTVLDVGNTCPLSRIYHTLDVINDKVFVFAGDTHQDFSDLYIFHLDKNKWSKPLYEGNVNLRCHCSSVLHDKLIIFGGIQDKINDFTLSVDILNNSLNSSKKDALASMPNSFSTSSSSSCPSIANAVIPSLFSHSSVITKKLFFLNVLEIKKNFSASEFKFKLITVGDSGVGKSCLLTRFVQDVYLDSHVSTIGVDFKSIVTMVKGKLCTLQIWDTAGQERFSGVTGNYYRNADAFVLVFDATRRESFQRIPIWIDQIKEHHECNSNNTVLLLIGNKFDLKSQICVSDDEARIMAHKIGAMYISTSAKTAVNVDVAFLSMAHKLVEIRRRYSNQKLMPRGGGLAEATACNETKGKDNVVLRRNASGSNTASMESTCAGGCGSGIFKGNGGGGERNCEGILNHSKNEAN